MIRPCFNMAKLLILGLVYIYIIDQIAGDIHPIDVEPVMKKEQPDFEDDTGLGIDSTGGRVKEVADVIDEPMVAFKFSSGLNFANAFIASLSVIIVSELGDKTFFIAAIMAMSHPRMTVFIGAMTALTLMHIMSALFGYVITYVPRIYTFYVSTALFAIFGGKMLREGCKMNPDDALEEFEEVQAELRKRDDSERDMASVEDAESFGHSVGSRTSRLGRNIILRIVSRVFLQAFTLTFLAEWGDRSQIATVVLAARENIMGVIIGGLLGHFLCTGLAVIGGRMIAARISVRTVTIIGGIVFLLFALSALIIGP